MGYMGNRCLGVDIYVTQKLLDFTCYRRGLQWENTCTFAGRLHLELKIKRKRKIFF